MGDFAERLKAAVKEAADAASADVRVGVNDADLRAKLDDAKARVREFGATDATATLSVSDERAHEALDDIRVQLEEIDKSTTDVRLELEDGSIAERLDELSAKLDEFGAKREDPKLGLDDSEFDRKLDEDKAKLDAAGSSSGSFSMPGFLTSPMTGIGGLLTAILPGIGGAATGLAGLGGAGALAFGGIAQALSAAHQASQTVGQTSATLAATAFANQQAIVNANQAIASAEQQAAQDAITSAQSIITAQQQIGASEHAYTDALFAERQAQYNLTQARLQAQLQLQSLNNAEVDGKLNVQAATLALQQAQYNQQQTDANANTTQLQREQAALAVAQAQQQLVEAQQAATNATNAANVANKQGVSGNPQVIAAQQALKDAIYGVSAARQAEQNAIRAVALAQEQASYQQKRDAQAVQQAQQNLIATEKAQALQAAATASTANQAAAQFAKDMARLSAPARAVVNELLSMRGAFRSLETVAQTAVAPGVMIFLRGVKSILPEIKTGVREFAGLIGGMFASIGKEMQTSGFKQVFSGLLNEGVVFVKTVFPAIGRFVSELAVVGSKKGAVGGLAGILAGIADGLAGVLQGLAPFTSGLSSALSSIGQALTPLGQLFGTIIGGLATALAPLLKNLLPGLTQFVSVFDRNFANNMQALAPAMARVGTGISSLLTALSEIIPFISKTGVAFDKFLVPVLTGIGDLIGQLPGRLRTDFADWDKWWHDFLNSPKQAFDGIGKAATFWWKNVMQPVYQGIETGAVWLYNNGFKWLYTQVNTIFGGIRTAALFLWHNVFDPLWQGIESGARGFVSAFGTIWNTLKTTFGTPVHFLVDTVYDKGIAALWNDVVKAIGLSKLSLPIITVPFAAGGVVPGYAPGQDTVHAVLSPGEGVLVPGAVRAIGPDTVHALNAAYGPGGKSDGVHFAPGGILGGIGSVLSGIGHGISGAFHNVTGWLGKGFDIIKMITAVATGNTGAFVNAASKAIGTSAAGELGQIMIAMPKTLVTDLANKLVTAAASVVGLGGGGPGGKLPGGGTGAVGNLPANWRTIAGFLSTHGFTKYAAAGVAGNIFAESGGNPEILQIGGGGGGGLIQWTPYPAGYITGNYAADLMTQLYAILHWGGGPGLVNRATSPSNAALIYQDYYERPASLTATIGTRMASANAVANAMGWGKFDNGGVLMPGTVGVNTTGKPEAVLTPAESQAIKALGHALAQRGGSAGIGPSSVTQIFNGTGPLSAENLAEMRRDLALALGGP